MRITAADVMPSSASSNVIAYKGRNEVSEYGLSRTASFASRCGQRLYSTQAGSGGRRPRVQRRELVHDVTVRSQQASSGGAMGIALGTRHRYAPTEALSPLPKGPGAKSTWTAGAILCIKNVCSSIVQQEC